MLPKLHTLEKIATALFPDADAPLRAFYLWEPDPGTRRPRFRGMVSLGAIVTAVTYLRGWEARDLARAAGLPLAWVRALMTDQEGQTLARLELQARMIKLGAALEVPPARLLSDLYWGHELRALARTARRVKPPTAAQQAELDAIRQRVQAHAARLRTPAAHGRQAQHA